MTSNRTELKRPIRVVMFGSGPKLTLDVKKFLCRLESHLEIVMLGAFCQAESQTLWAVGEDLLRRRGFLALPLMLAWIASDTKRFLLQPRAVIKMNRKLDQMSDRIHFVPDIHVEGVLNHIRSLAPDLGLIYGSPILKPELFEIPTLGTLGIHHGKVPEYRGNKTCFWAMFNGEKTAGVTIQQVNAGLDTGNIVKEDAVSIGYRSYQAVWRDLEELGLNLYIQAILEVKNGTATFRPQPRSNGKLYRNPKLGDFLAFWVIQTKRRLRKT